MKEKEEKGEEEKKEEKKEEKEEKAVKRVQSIENYHNFDIDFESIQPIKKEEKLSAGIPQRKRKGLSLAQYFEEIE